MRMLSSILACLAVVPALLWTGPAPAQDQAAPAPGGSEKRIALVVGNADYKAGALATPANDAGLVAQTLQAAGFDVVGARDLDEDSLRKAMRDFTDKAAASGPDTVAFVYLAGYGLQLNGENYFAPVDAEIASAADVPVQSLRVSDYKRRLAAIPLKGRFVVLDAGRNNPFAKSGDPLAGGLAMTEAEPGSLVAFNAAPGTVGPEEKGPYGAYAQALVEMIRDGGLSPDQLFDRVRLRVSETTQGAEVPWNASKLDPGFVFFQRAADAPKIADPQEVSAIDARPLRDLGPKEAYTAALKRDTVKGYQEFADAYPKEPVTKRVRALAAARRESVTWRRTYEVNTPDAYWSYLSRYPRGPHAYDCRRRLRELSVALEPPPSYAAISYDVPPPPPEEVVYVERPVVYFSDPVYDLPPPPPPPAVYLPPPPAYIVDLAPPPPVYDYYALPVPAFAPLPAYVAAPAYIAPPPNNVYYSNIHNTVVINEINQQNVVYSQQRREGGFGGNGAAIGAGAVAGAALGAAATRVTLPPAVQQRAAAGIPPAGIGIGRPGRPGIGPNGQPPAPQANRPGAPNLPVGPNGRPQMGQPLPGQQNAQPLPQQANRPGVPNPQVGPNGQPVQGQQNPQQANRPGAPNPQVGPNGQPVQGQQNPQQANRPGAPNPQVGPNGQPIQGQQNAQQANRPGAPNPQVGPNGQPVQGQQNAQQANRPGMANSPATPQGAPRVDPRTGKPMPNPNGGVAAPTQQTLQQTRDQQQPAVQPNRPQTPQDRLQAAREAQQQKAQAAQAAQQQRQQAGQAAQAQKLQQAQERQQALQQQRQQAASQREAAQAQRLQAAQQQRQQAQQQQAQQRQQQLQERQQVQRQQQMQAAQQQRAAQQQQAAQQRQMMMQQQQAQRQQMMHQQQAQQRQMMMQQQAQRQQMMQRPPPQPHGGGGGHCPPGRPCR